MRREKFVVVTVVTVVRLWGREDWSDEMGKGGLMGDGGRGTSARALLIRRGAGDRVTGLLLAWGG